MGRHRRVRLSRHTITSLICAAAAILAQAEALLGAEPPETDRRSCEARTVRATFWGHGNTCSEGRIAVAVGEVTYSASESPTASTSRPKTCATYEAPEEGAAPASEHQTMPLAGELVVGQRYFIGCHYTDSPGELAYRDFFVYQPGEEGPVLEALARELARDLPLPQPTPATSPPLDREQIVGLPTWLWIDPADWRPVSLAVELSGFQVAVTATPVRLDWDLGEHEDARVTCHGPGTPWTPEAEAAGRTSDCAWVFQRVPDPPATAYPASVTLVWDVSYTATGQAGGSLGRNATTTGFELQVAERQAVVCYDTPAGSCDPA